MIFATVGTTQFDELVEAIDKIAPKLNEEVVLQIGNHKYVPKNCKYFTFDDDLLKYFIKANIIIAHGGAGITFEVLNLSKKLISVDNPHVLDGHQGDLLGKLSQEGYLIWCNDLNKIENCIEDARKMKIKKYVRPECEIGKMIVGWLG
ncbi:MAG: PssE/Cps14G family polysaccharide biosynthesis glycosyltransferase [Deltaproteobacteria bacterium]|nr:PssE/Cps14G family polysaccharide biosynthesis glycosyltransferase [Deltaproteobacteria bacterium]